MKKEGIIIILVLGLGLVLLNYILIGDGSFVGQSIHITNKEVDCSPHQPDGLGNCIAEIPADPSDTCLGFFRLGSGQPWETLRSAKTALTLCSSNDTILQGPLNLLFNRNFLLRTALAFNTTSIPVDASISSAELEMTVLRKGRVYPTDFENDYITLVKLDLINPPKVTKQDFINFGDTEGATNRFDVGLNTTPDSKFTFNLNETGKNWINKGDWTSLGLRGSLDLYGAQSLPVAYIQTWFYSADSEKKPVLKITYKKPIITEPSKDRTLYSKNEVFLISSEDWKTVLPLVPITTWTGNERWCQKGTGTPEKVCVYPTLIYHYELNDSDTQTGEGFDADSIIFFLQQYAPKKVTIVAENFELDCTNGVDDDGDGFDDDNDIDCKLTNLLKADNETDQLEIQKNPSDFVGPGLDDEQIRLLNPNKNYLLYWNNYYDVVFVEENYELALLASSYASLINAPLIIEGSFDDESIFIRKNVICIGSVSPPKNGCGESYDLKQLKQKFIEKTNTNKIILVNPNDLDIKIEKMFSTEKSVGEINNLFTSTSLAAPLLASAKHELILSVSESDYKSVDKFVEDQVESLQLDAEYLTIIGSPNAIEMSKVRDQGEEREEVDNHLYGNLDADSFQELAVGRIFSLTISDVSSYLNRVLFYSHIPKNSDFSIMWPGMPGNSPNMKTEALAIEEIFTRMGFNSRSFYTDERISPEASEYKNKFMITYLDHSGVSGGRYSFNTPDLRSNEIWLNSSMVFFEGCLSCAFGLISDVFKERVFCANLIRRGAIMDYGAAVDASAMNWDPAKMIVEELLEGKDIGSAVKTIRNKASMWGIKSNSENPNTPRAEYDVWHVLIGDPTFNPNFEKPVLEELTVNLNQVTELEYIIDIYIPQTNKNIEINYVDNIGEREERVEVKLFNYPFGNNIGRIIKRSTKKFDNSTGLELETNDYQVNRLIFEIEIPNGYKISRVTPQDDASIFFERDLGTENKYYFIMEFDYDNSIIQFQDSIPPQEFEIFINLEQVEDTCQDSDVVEGYLDGINPYEKGVTSLSTGVSKTDRCIDNNLFEYYCIDNFEIGTIDIACNKDKYCFSGKCVDLSCGNSICEEFEECDNDCSKEEWCSDEIDNDGDGLTDCSDYNCCNNIACSSLSICHFNLMGVGQITKGNPLVSSMDGPNSVFVYGDYAFVASSRNSLAVIDVSVPFNPQAISQIRAEDDANISEMRKPMSVFVSGDYAFVANYSGDSLAIIDVSDPHNLIGVSQIRAVDDVDISSMDGPSSVFVSGDYAFVANYNGDSLAVIDVSNPYHPEGITQITKSGSNIYYMEEPRSVFVSGDYAFVASEFGNSLAVIDVSDPHHLIGVSQIRAVDDVDISSMDGPSSVFVSGDYAFVASEFGNSLVVIDVSDPYHLDGVSQIRAVDNVDIYRMVGPSSVFVSNGNAFVASANGDSLAVIDVSNPLDLIPKGQIFKYDDIFVSAMFGPSSVFVSGDYAFVASSTGDSLNVIVESRLFDPEGV